MVELILTEDSIRSLIATVNDPEVPAINIIELGIVRAVSIIGGKVIVTVTPTYSGCPAMHMIEEEIRRVLTENGVAQVEIQTVYSPAWTTDWMDEHARMKLKQYGIAPPHSVQSSPVLQIELPQVSCPHCDSAETKQKSEFGSTACKSYFYCHSCQQPFEYFKSF
jgi:ring-1,2-phenylacetyl-CoA epoxidase subunit PaaD